MQVVGFVVCALSNNPALYKLISVFDLECMWAALTVSLCEGCLSVRVRVHVCACIQVPDTIWECGSCWAIANFSRQKHRFCQEWCNRKPCKTQRSIDVTPTLTLLFMSNLVWSALCVKAAIITILIIPIHQMTVCNMEEAVCSDELTENHPTLPLSISVETRVNSA